MLGHIDCGGTGAIRASKGFDSEIGRDGLVSSLCDQALATYLSRYQGNEFVLICYGENAVAQ